jgi:SAM-dependent methyltransferase
MAVPDITVDPFYERDLQQMASATNYLRWQLDLIKPYVRGHVLEVGAGIGTFTRRLAPLASRLTALEPNRYCFDRITRETAHLSNVTCLQLTAEEFHARDPAGATTVDTVVCTNVLEHIKDDAAILRELRGIIAPTGHLALQIPATPAAFGEIDRRLGHYRRYTKRGVRELLRATGWRLIYARYFNLIGLLGWLWNTRVSIKHEQSDRQIWLFDRVLVPLMSRLEALVPLPVGQCLVAIAVPDTANGVRT